MALKFVDELPEGVNRRTNTSSVFTDDLADELREHPGKWALIEKGTGQGAAAWKKRMELSGAEGFEYRSIDTGKPDGKRRKAPKGNGTYQPTIKEIYVRFNPDGGQ